LNSTFPKNKIPEKELDESIIDGLDVSLENKLVQLVADEGFKMIFKTISFARFWIKSRQEYPEPSVIALRDLFLFPFTYLCETGFSAKSIVTISLRLQTV